MITSLLPRSLAFLLEVERYSHMMVSIILKYPFPLLHIRESTFNTIYFTYVGMAARQKLVGEKKEGRKEGRSVSNSSSLFSLSFAYQIWPEAGEEGVEARSERIERASGEGKEGEESQIPRLSGPHISP